jgi:hypothetical protein
MAGKHVVRGAWLALALVLTVAGAARADDPLYSSVIRASGTADAPEFLTSIEMPITAAGRYQITTTDKKWLNVPLQGLSFGVFTSKGTIASKEGAGVLEFFNAGQGKVFLQIYALTGAPYYAGLIGVKAETMAVVALPSSLLLLASALGGAAFLRPRRRGDLAAAGGLES